MVKDLSECPLIEFIVFIPAGSKNFLGADSKHKPNFFPAGQCQYFKFYIVNS